jgi:hypothetical protein
MSFVKGFIEYQEHDETLVSVLKYLDENDSFPEDETRGIARSIIEGHKPHDLNTRSQRWSFYERIEPLLKNIRCEDTACNAQIGISSLEETFHHKEPYGALLCFDCLINKWREEYLEGVD